MWKKYNRKKSKVDIPAIIKALADAERFILSDDVDERRIGASMKSFFERLLAKRQLELREAIEKAAALKRKKFWREVPRKDE
jgi:hypothetical protein